MLTIMNEAYLIGGVESKDREEAVVSYPHTSRGNH